MQLEIFKRKVKNYENENIFISFSGGLSSAYLLIKFVKENPNNNFLVCFANTGDENEKTLQFIENVSRYYNIKIYWLEAYISPIKGKGVFPVMVNYKTASRDATPLIEQSKKYGAAGISAPHCTRDLKVGIMHKFAKHYFKGEDYITLQGIRYDETTRINWKKAKDNNWIYPLAEWGVTKVMVNIFWTKHEIEHGFTLGLKEEEGNCNLCFKKSDRKLIKLIRDKPCLVLTRITMDLLSSNDKHDMYRGNRDIFDLLEIANDQTQQIKSLSAFGGECFCS